jgi:hypothetical protein
LSTEQVFKTKSDKKSNGGRFFLVSCEEIINTIIASLAAQFEEMSKE